MEDVSTSKHHGWLLAKLACVAYTAELVGRGQICCGGETRTLWLQAGQALLFVLDSQALMSAVFRNGTPV